MMHASVRCNGIRKICVAERKDLVPSSHSRYRQESPCSMLVPSLSVRFACPLYRMRFRRRLQAIVRPKTLRETTGKRPARPQRATGKTDSDPGVFLAQWLARFSFTISCLKLNTCGSLGSTIARTQCVSGKPKVSTLVKFSMIRPLVEPTKGLSTRKM